MQPLKVAALISGQPGPQELWTLRNIASVPSELHVVQALHATTVPRSKRAKRLIKEYGLFRTASRFAGGVVGSRVGANDRKILNDLFDFAALGEWWERSGIARVEVRALNDAESKSALSAIAPDVIVRVSGGVLKPHIFSQAKLATLNIHHGQAPMIRGMWSIPWGIVEGRRDWIGATVHVIDEGIDTGTILWRGGPQLAPGDTNVDLLFRTHLEAVNALVEILKTYARGETPKPWILSADETSTYRSAAGLWDWMKLLSLGRGRKARFLIERGIEC
jgi:folate-dependent phosphoribosylglycinamide formyltransferase PurN